MDEAKTKLILEAETRGFDKVQKIVEQVVGTVEGSGSKPGALAGLDRTLAGLATSLSTLNAAVQTIAASAGTLQKATQQGRGTGTGTGAAGGGMNPNLFRGVLQGLGVAQYLPGVTTGALATQAGGALLGRGVRGIAGGIAGSAFSGIQAMIQGASSVPGGGFVAGPMQAAVAAVEQALDLQRAQQGAAFALDMTGGNRAARRARAAVGPEAAAASATASSSFVANANQERIDELEKFVAEGWKKAAMGGAAYRDGGVEMRILEDAENKWRTLVDGGQTGGTEEAAIAARAARAGGAASGRVTSAADSAAASARFQAMYGMSSGAFAGLGIGYGMDQTELTRFASETVRGRGGLMGDMGRGGGTQAALAASVLGIDSGTSGRVLRGANIGAGLGPGSEGEVLARTIGRAMALGLEGSEIAEDIARTAQGIEQFERTGIPVADSARGDVARTLMGAGMAPSVAAGRAGAFTGAIQNRAMQGLPTGAADFASLVKLGGYSGGGTEEALEALFRMQRGDITGAGVLDLARSFAGVLPTGPSGRAFGIQRGFAGLGFSLGPDEARAMDMQSRKEALPPEMQATYAETLKRIAHSTKIKSASDLDDYARQGVGGGLVRDAGIRQTKLGAGQTAMSTVQDFEARTARMAESFSKVVDKLSLLNPLLDGLTSVVDNIVNVATGRANQSGGN